MDFQVYCVVCDEHHFPTDTTCIFVASAYQRGTVAKHYYETICDLMLAGF